MFRFDNYESCTNVKQQVGDTIPMFTTIVCEILGCLRPILLSEKYVYFVHFVFFQQKKKKAIQFAQEMCVLQYVFLFGYFLSTRAI